jgi:serine/threonine protein kinase
VRSLGCRVALGALCLHQAGLLHGALCPQHVLLLPPACSDDRRDDNSSDAQHSAQRWVLCDFSASLALRARSDSEFLSPASAVAARYLPPEAVLLQEPSFAESDDADAFSDADAASFVAATLQASLKLVARGVAEAWAPGALRASVAADAWSLGAMLFEAATSMPLLPDGDAQSALCALARWDASALERALCAVAAAAAALPHVPADAAAAAALASLLRRLLARAPEGRPASMRDVLASQFLNPSGATLPERAADIAAAAAFCASPGGASGGGVLLGVPRGSGSPSSGGGGGGDGGAWLNGRVSSGGGSERSSERASAQGWAPWAPSPAGSANVGGAGGGARTSPLPPRGSPSPGPYHGR